MVDSGHRETQRVPGSRMMYSPFETTSAIVVASVDGLSSQWTRYNWAAHRSRINSGLDRVENFNYLARHLFYARRGENWEREFEEQHNRASALLILANACVLWNSVHLSEIYQKLKSEGLEFLPEDFRHVSPYAFEHIIPYGQYFFNLRRKNRRDAFSRAQRL